MALQTEESGKLLILRVYQQIQQKVLTEERLESPESLYCLRRLPAIVLRQIAQ